MASPILAVTQADIDHAWKVRDEMIAVARARADNVWGATQGEMREAQAEYLAEVFAAHRHAATQDLLGAARDAEWAIEGLVEEQELGDECPRMEGATLCGASCCENSGCAVERLDRVRAAITRATGAAK